MERVVDCVVGPDRRQLLFTVVSSPLIAVYCHPTPEMTLQCRQEGCCSAIRNNFVQVLVSDLCDTSRKPTPSYLEDAHGGTREGEV